MVAAVLKLPRLKNTVPIAEKDGKPSNFMILNWDNVCRSIEGVTPGTVTTTGDVPIIGYITITAVDGSTIKIPVVG